MTIQDQAIRQRALSPAHSFIVQAPAGSGKTELLTQRYLVLLSHAQKAPEEIVAITFTRKAAAEMRTRILHALSFGTEKEPDKNDYRHTTWTLAQSVLEKDRTLQWDIMRNPNRLRIFTIDALAAFLCRQTPMLTQFGASPAICEKASALYELASEKLLTHLASEKKSNVAIERLLLHLDNNVDNLKKLFSSLLAQREQWLPPILFCYHNQPALQKHLENSLKNVVIEKLQLAAAHIPQASKQILVLLARHAGNYFSDNAMESPFTACADFVFEIKPDLSAFSSWFGLANLLLTKEGEWRKTVNINQGFAPKDSNKSLMLELLTQLNTDEILKTCLQDIIACPPITYTELQWETLTALTQILPLLAAQLTLVFQEKGQIDFVELNLAALKALGDSEAITDLALYLDYQIQHLLIDEFQDTSVSQLHLLEKLTAGWEPYDGRTLFLVGDPMQSIYRFRNAEVGLFIRAQQQGIGNIALESLTLSMNFRSQKNLVTWFNDAFSVIFPADASIATGRVPYTAAIAAKPAIDYGTHFYPIVSDNDEDEALLIAKKIQLLQAANPSDKIAILVRSRAHLITIIAYLRKYQLAFEAVDIETLADCPSIQDLLSLTRALLHRADRIAWLAILRAPWCGLTLADLEAISLSATKTTLWEAILAAETIEPLSPDGLRRILSLRNCLKNAFSTQYQQSFAQWIEGTWMMLGGPACLTNQIELPYSRAYFELIETLEKENTLVSMEELTTHCKKLYANALSTTQITLQIMTIHKSKGLEFDHVFLPNLQRKTTGSEQQLFRWLDRPNALGGDDLLLAPMKSIAQKNDPIYDYLKMVEHEKLDHETTRLFYVAATRAKKSLHLSGRIKIDLKTANIKTPENSSFLGKLWPVYQESIDTLLIASQQKAEIRTLSLPKHLHTRLSHDWQLPTMPTHCFSTQTEISDAAKKVNINIDIQPVFSRVIGTVMHEILQSIAENNAPFAKAQWRSRLHSLGILPTEMEAALNTIHTAIQTTITDPRGQWILSPHRDARCEWALTCLNAIEQQHFIIDRTFIDENNTRWIIDYKTAVPDNAETNIIFLEKQKANYKTQLENYAGIVAQRESCPIKLGLYFPLCAQWIAWDYVTDHATL